MAEYLRTRLPNPVLITSFLWSGRNSISARWDAAKNLRSHLSTLISAHPTAEHYAIGHSHGGSAIAYAIRGTDLESKMAGIVCLSTPFVEIHRRWAGPNSLAWSVATFMHVLLVYALIATLAALTITSAFVLNTLVGLITPMKLGLEWGTPFGLIGTYFFFRSISKDRDHAKRLIGEISALPPLAHINLLIIRGNRDEAAAALATSEFISWVLTHLWNLAGTGATRLKARWDTISHKLGRSFHLGVGLSAGVLIMMMPFGRYLPHWGVLFVRACFWFVAVYLGLGVLVMLPSGLLQFIGPVFAVFTSLFVIPFAPELVWTHLLTEVTVESLPPGPWLIYQIPQDNPSCADTGLSTSLMHGASYEDERALGYMTNWILSQPRRV